MTTNAFDSKVPQWISGVTAKQANRATGAEQQLLLRPESKNSLATQSHITQLNDHVYTGKLDADHAVFTYNPLQKGDMAKMLDGNTQFQEKQPPGGRARAAQDFFES